MTPSKGTERRTIRVKPELWEAAMKAAAENGEDVSSVVRAALERYVKQQESGGRSRRPTP